MERALYESEMLIASKIASDNTQEEKIRKLSKLKKLRCPDCECQNPILRYCRGEKKGAYFAHLSKCNCDYSKFDLIDTPVIKAIREKLFEHFKSCNYVIEKEVKIIPHHYTHLLLHFPDGSQLALEIGTKQTSIDYIENITKHYVKQEIPVKWIVVDEILNATKEEQAFPLKRHLLNAIPRNSLILISSKGNEIVQYIVVESTIYTERRLISDLTIERGEITLKGFEQRLEEWKKSESSKNISQPKYQLKEPNNNIGQQKKSLSSSEKASRYEKYYDALRNTREPVWDVSNNARLRLCLHCNTPDIGKKFVSEIFYDGNFNWGCCKECNRKKKPRQF